MGIRAGNEEWPASNRAWGGGLDLADMGACLCEPCMEGWQMGSTLKGGEEQELSLSIKAMCFYKCHQRRTAVYKATQGFKGEPKLGMRRGRGEENIASSQLP